MRDQLALLIEISKRSNVSLQVLPFLRGAYLGMVGAFTLLDVGGNDLRVVTVDSLSEMSYREEPTQVANFRLSLERLRVTALDESASRRLIEELLSNHER